MRSSCKPSWRSALASLRRSANDPQTSGGGMAQCSTMQGRGGQLVPKRWREVGSMGQRVDDTALDTLFRQARSYTKWQLRPVTDEMVRDLYDLLKWAPTSANAAPARFAFLRSKEAKERLRPALAPLNVEKTMTAPVTVIVAYDLRFYEQLPKLFPQKPGMAKLFESNAEMVETTAKRNSSLQGAYMMMAARSLGLDC